MQRFPRLALSTMGLLASQLYATVQINQFTPSLSSPQRVGTTITFSHEIQILPNGDTMAIGATEKIFPAGTQGSTGPVDIPGDTILILDANLQVKWLWDAYDHLDINRRAILNETCVNNEGGCPPVLLAPVANDWLHGNSLYYIPSEGNLLYSSRHLRTG
jgi:Arylsulfotransferase (ASST)